MRTVLYDVALAILMIAPRGAAAVTIYGVRETDSGANLISFDSAAPGVLLTDVPFSGLAQLQTMSHIDFRPATGQLYGLAFDGSISNAFLYTIDPVTAVATPVGGAIPLPQAAGAVVSGTGFGFDFNPVTDEIRVNSNTNDNYRIDPDTGSPTPDDALSRDSVEGAAFSNNFAGAATTTLYVIDTFNDVLARQGGVNGVPSPNGGVVTTIGPLGVDGLFAGFDIAGASTAYLKLAVGFESSLLYTVALGSGAVTLVGEIGDDINVFSIAVALQRAPAPAAPAPALSWLALVACVTLLAVIAYRHLRSRA